MTTVQVELWQLLGALVAGAIIFFGAVWVLLDKLLDSRFKSQDAARAQGQLSWQETFAAHMEAERREAEILRGLERDFANFRAEMPLHYVRREDYVRGQTVIEAKLDALYSELKVVQIKGAQT
jgi:hypothetical protein